MVIFRNNSETSWLNYNAGGASLVDIPAKSVIEVDARVATVLQRNLCDKPAKGQPSKWLEKISEADLTAEEKKSLRPANIKINSTEAEEIKKEEIKTEKKSKKK